MPAVSPLSRLLAAVVLAVGPVSLYAAESEDLVQISGPTTATPGGYFIVSVLAPPPADDVKSEVSVKVPDGASPPIELLGKRPGESVYLYQGVIRGVYAFRAEAQKSIDKAEGFDPHDADELTVTVGPLPPGPGPQPPGPQPPGPQPPDPTPDAAPFPAKGLTVLFVIDEARKNELSSNQRAILWGAETRDLLNSRTIEGPDGVTNEWRVWFDTTDPAPAGEPWVSAMKAAKEPPDGLVKVAISNGKGGAVLPLNPEMTPAQFRELLSKY